MHLASGQSAVPDRLRGGEMARVLGSLLVILPITGCFNSRLLQAPVPDGRVQETFQCAIERLRENGYQVELKKGEYRGVATRRDAHASVLGKLLASGNRDVINLAVAPLRDSSSAILAEVVRHGDVEGPLITTGSNSRVARDGRSLLDSCAGPKLLDEAATCGRIVGVLYSGDVVRLQTAAGTVEGSVRWHRGDTIAVATPFGLRPVPIWDVHSTVEQLRLVPRERVITPPATVGAFVGGAVGLGLSMAWLGAYHKKYPNDISIGLAYGFIPPLGILGGAAVGALIGGLPFLGKNDPTTRWEPIRVPPCPGQTQM